jgi:hypothetical protein
VERAFEGLKSADGFALLDLAEAERVRACGWRGPVLLLEGCFEPRDLELCSRLNLWHVVHTAEQIDWLAAHKTHEPHRVFLKMNSGMNRLGFAPQAFRSAYARLNALPQVDEVSLMTHFSDADAPRGIAHQIATFEAATADLPGERSLSNSAAILRHGATPGLRNDWVRAGILSYGSAPDYPERQEWVAAEQHHQAAGDLDRVADEHHPALGDAVGEGADEGREHDVEQREHRGQRGHLPGRCLGEPQHLDGGHEQCVVGQRAEELRRHDGREAFFHRVARRAGAAVNEAALANVSVSSLAGGLPGPAGYSMGFPTASRRHATPDRSPRAHRRAGAQPRGRAPPCR